MLKLAERRIFTSILKLSFLILVIIFQLVFIALIYGTIHKFYIYYFALFEIINLISVIHLNYKDKNASYKISWILLILLIPVIGVLIYILSRIGINHNFRRINKLKMDKSVLIDENQQTLSDLKKKNKVRYNETRLIKNISNCITYSNTKVDYFPSGEEMYKKLIVELKKAKKFIFLEYFIISDGQMWNNIFEILKKKADSGVEVRILVDYIGSLFVFPKNLKKSAKAHNIKLKIFNPFKIMLNFMLNYRDHRKITIIDGRIAFNGGINIGDEYINLYKKYGYWKDMSICLHGQAVYSFTIMFLKMWQSIIKKREDFKKYKFIADNTAKNTNNGIVIPYYSGPVKQDEIAEDIYINIINSAKDYIYITTPYLVIGHEIILALCLAAKKGVDVRIITPSIPDKKIIQILTRSHYDKLLEAGVKIYEYTPGFIHGKVFLSDNECAIVGTINMDYRSLFLHFECATYMYGVPAIKDIYKDLMNTIETSNEIQENVWKNRNLIKKIIESILRMFAPLV